MKEIDDNSIDLIVTSPPYDNLRNYNGTCSECWNQEKFHRIAKELSRVLKDGGIFITSGIIHDRVDMVCEKLEATGFEVIEKNSDGEWNCIVAKLK